jgi:hypothetical protein
VSCPLPWRKLAHGLMKRTPIALTTVLTWTMLALLGPGLCYAGSARLAWDPNPEPDIAGYIVRYGTQSRTYTGSVDVGNSTTGDVTGLANGQRYYFALEAYNSGGLHSPLSDEISADLPGGTTQTLTVVVLGSGTVTSTVPPAMSCGASCSQAYPTGTAVTLTPTPQPGAVFAGWTGDADCTDSMLAMSTDHTCTAQFVMRPSVTVTLSNLSPVYNGTARAITVTTTPPGLAVMVTYNGAAAAPTAVGT